MRKSKSWAATVAAAAVCLLPATLSAQDLKIGVVDMQRAIVQTVEGKKAETAFTTKLEEYRKNIETRQKALKDAQNKLKTQDRLLDDKVRAERTRDIERQTTELNRLQEDAQKDLETLRNDLMRPIAEVAQAVLNAYAKEENFSLIVDRSEPQNDSILYVNEKNEITDAIIKRIDAELAKTAKKPPQ